MVPVVLLLVTFFAFGITAYTEGVHWLHILLLFALYGWACLPFMYVLSFIFTVPASGFVWLTIFNILSGGSTITIILNVTLSAKSSLILEENKAGFCR